MTRKIPETFISKVKAVKKADKHNIHVLLLNIYRIKSSIDKVPKNKEAESLFKDPDKIINIG